MDRKSMLMAAWNLNRSLPLLIGGLLLLNVAVYLALTYGAAPQLDRLERKLIEQQSLVRQIQQGGGGESSTASVYRRGLADLGKFDAAIPGKNEFTALIGEIFTLADQAGLSIDRISYDPKEIAGQGLLRYGLGFSVSGDYGRIKRFIYELEQSDRLIVIDDLTLSGAGDGDAKVDLRLKLATFFRTEAA